MLRHAATAVLLSALALGSRASGAVQAEKPCKVFMNAVVGDGDKWGESFLDHLKEAILKSHVVTLASSADDAGLEILIVTARNGPNSTAVTRVIASVLRVRLSQESPAGKGEVGISPHVVLAVVRGPRLGIYKEPNLAEGVASEVNILTGTSMLAVCKKFSDVTLPAPNLPK